MFKMLLANAEPKSAPGEGLTRQVSQAVESVSSTFGTVQAVTISVLLPQARSRQLVNSEIWEAGAEDEKKESRVSNGSEIRERPAQVGFLDASQSIKPPTRG